VGKVNQNPNVSNLTTWESLRDYTAILFNSIVDIISGNLSFADNHKCKILDYTFAVADIEYALTHDLGFVPSGYIVVNAAAATSVYNGSAQWTYKYIYVKASIATTVKMIIF
jgi:hypothetical protein